MAIDWKKAANKGLKAKKKQKSYSDLAKKEQTKSVQRPKANAEKPKTDWNKAVSRGQNAQSGGKNKGKSKTTTSSQTSWQNYLKSYTHKDKTIQDTVRSAGRSLANSKKTMMSNSRNSTVASSWGGKTDWNKAAKLGTSQGGNTRVNNKVVSNTLTNEEMNKLSVAAMSNNLENLLKGDKKLAKKVAQIDFEQLTAGGASTASQAALGAMTMGNSSVDRNIANGMYTKKQREAIQKAKESNAYMAGTMIGEGVNFATAGVGGSSIASGLLKGSTKALAKGTVKASGKNIAKKIGAETLGDAIASAPMNVVSSYKQSLDANGKFNKKAFLKNMAVNEALDIGIGGAVSGTMAGWSAKNVKKFADIVEKVDKKGVYSLSNEELKTFEQLTGKYIGEDTDIITKGAVDKAKGYKADGTLGDASDLRTFRGDIDNIKQGKETVKPRQDVVSADYQRATKKFDSPTQNEYVADIYNRKMNGEDITVGEQQMLDRALAREEFTPPGGSTSRMVGENTTPMTEEELFARNIGELTDTGDINAVDVRNKINSILTGKTKASAITKDYNTLLTKIDDLNERLKVAPEGSRNSIKAQIDELQGLVDDIERNGLASPMNTYEGGKATSRMAGENTTHLSDEELFYTNMDDISRGNLDTPDVRRGLNDALREVTEENPTVGRKKVDLTPEQKNKVSQLEKQIADVDEELKTADDKLKQQLTDYRARLNDELEELRPTAEKTINEKAADLKVKDEPKAEPKPKEEPKAEEPKELSLKDKVDEYEKLLKQYENEDGNPFELEDKMDALFKNNEEFEEAKAKLAAEKPKGGNEAEIDNLLDEYDMAKYDWTWADYPHPTVYKRLDESRARLKELGVDNADIASMERRVDRYEKLLKRYENGDGDADELKSQMDGIFNSRDKYESGKKWLENKKAETKVETKAEEPKEKPKEKKKVEYTDKKRANGKKVKKGDTAEEVIAKREKEGKKTGTTDLSGYSAEDLRKIANGGTQFRRKDAEDFMLHYRRQYKQAPEELRKIYKENEGDMGFARKQKYGSSDDNLAKARKEVENDLYGAYKTFLNSKPEDNPALFNARQIELQIALSNSAKENVEDATLLLHVMDHSNPKVSNAGQVLAYRRWMLAQTPEGKIRMAQKEVNRLNKEFGNRLKGKKLELSDDQLRLLANCKTDDDYLKAFEQIGTELQDQIPATAIEKFNEWRHFAMLFNVRTHERNIFGNNVFRAARAETDLMEYLLYKTPLAKPLEKMGDSAKKSIALPGEAKKYNKPLTEEFAERLGVNAADYKDKGVLDAIFQKTYSMSGSKNRYIDAMRNTDSTALKGVAGKLVKQNYRLLEKEDMLTFKPAFKNEFIVQVKEAGLSLDDIAKLTDEQIDTFSRKALAKAEYATFRDASMVSDAISKLKQSTESIKTDSKLANLGLRGVNMILEGTMPFVKTPVNIFRRSIDYSPFGVFRATGQLIGALQKGDAALYKKGLSNLCAGLTGTQITVLGMWLYNQDAIPFIEGVTNKAGDVSGDAYYDREMGYQDYSLNLKIGDKKYSMSMDWVSPNQVSLFMGAEIARKFKEGGLSGFFEPQNMYNAFIATCNPILDMSFMSSARDTIETFAENAIDKNGTHWGDAIAQAVFGSLPQNYLSSFMPQMVSQVATATDKYARDSRSTAEDPITKSWESFGRKMANKIPGVRQEMLNPKYDRTGAEVKNVGENIVTRSLFALFSPPTVRKITTTDTDKELIKVYQKMPEEDRKYFFYQFTGNPDYAKGRYKNGEWVETGRMSYDELATYGKEYRKTQWQDIEDMVGAKSYKNMTDKMKQKEIDKYSNIAVTRAEAKTYGYKYVVDKICGDTGNYDSDEFKAYRSMVGYDGMSKKDKQKADKKLTEFAVGTSKLFARAHIDNNDYYAKSMAVSLYGNKKLATIYKINEDKIANSNAYVKKYKNAFKKYSDASANVRSEIKKVCGESESGNSVQKAMVAPKFKMNNDTRVVLGISADNYNMGYILNKNGKDLSAMETIKQVAGGGNMKKEEAIEYVQKNFSDQPSDVQACICKYLCPSAKFPIPNVTNSSDTVSGAATTSSGGSGYGGHRRGGGHRGGGGGGSSSGSSSWEDYLKEYGIGASSTTSSSKNVSGLTDAYRTKLNKVRKNRVKYKS